MPLPRQNVASIPENFDPTKHCGAAKADDSSPCMNPAGYRTDHLGTGRCRLHGSMDAKAPAPIDPKYIEQTAGKPGRDGKVAPLKISQRAAQIRGSVDLLSLDEDIARLRALVEFEWGIYEERIAEWQVVLNALKNAGLGDMSNIREWMETDGEIDRNAVPTLSWWYDKMPTMNMENVQRLSNIVNIAFNMRFSKRFSVPITEVHEMLGNVKLSFLQVCKEYNIPTEAAQRFVKLLEDNVKLPRTVDPVLMSAGGLPMIDGELVASD